MGKRQCNHGGLAPAQRGQIIQRVLADGWSPARAAQEFAVTERQVARWVAAYRRMGELLAAHGGCVVVASAPASPGTPEAAMGRG